MEEKNQFVREVAEQKYEFGFTTDVHTEIIEKGLNEDIVRLISAKKGEPEWMLEFRLKAFRYWKEQTEPTWGHVHVPEIDYQAISYYADPTAKKATVPDGSPSGEGRRAFLIGASVATATAALAQTKKKVDGGLAVIEDKVAPERKTPITPPGSLSAKHFFQHCTGCQLCVAQCPNEVLRPSTGLLTMMQPVMSYEHGYCRPECTRCSNVCPTGAIRPIQKDEKSSIQIGHAVWVKKNCIPVTDGVDCGNCARHCPTGAIEMVPLDPNDELGAYVPAVNESRCIGCGACENLCPARPFSAIYVEGHEVHQTV